MTWWTWREVIPAFTQAGIRTIAMDLRGFGTSDLAPGEVELTQLATDVAGVASALGISSYTVVGNGMGGVVAWMLGALKPAGLQAIVPVCALIRWACTSCVVFLPEAEAAGSRPCSRAVLALPSLRRAQHGSTVQSLSGLRLSTARKC